MNCHINELFRERERERRKRGKKVSQKFKAFAGIVSQNRGNANEILQSSN